MTSRIAFLAATLTLSACTHAPVATTARREPQGSTMRNDIFYVSEYAFSPMPTKKMLEGPSADRNGNVWIANVESRGTIGLWRQGELKPQVWFTLPDGGAAASTRLDANDRLWISDYKKHRLYSISPGDKSAKLEFESADLNQPNDFTIARDGTIYMTDPSWNSKKKGRIYKLSPAKELTMIADDLRAANGIDLSPDEGTLYYTESISGQLMKLDLRTEGAVPEKIFKFEPDTVDGLRVDADGNIYVARITQGTVDVVTPAGERFMRIKLNGKDPTNLAIGGIGGRTMFVTMRDSDSIELFKIPAAARGP